MWECRCGVHMDCMHWVSRDSYLPMGSRGLKVHSNPLSSDHCAVRRFSMHDLSYIQSAEARTWMYLAISKGSNELCSGRADHSLCYFVLHRL